MNSRTCQFCGKALSRIWTGGGGDFCSREHRNQHRLRCGMDTLLEANKHASLMRRRDQLRQFPAAHLQCNSAVSTREFPFVTSAAVRAVLRPLPSTCLPANARIVTGDGRFLLPPASGGLRGRLQARPKFAAKIRRISFRPPALVPTRLRSVAVGLARAGIAPIPIHQDIGKGIRRGFLMLAQTSRHAIVSASAFRALDVAPPGNLSGKRPRRLECAAKVGNAFRVSARKEFRLPSLSQPMATLPGPVARGLRWPENLPLAAVACIGQAISPFAAELDFPIPAAISPLDRKVRPAAGLQVARAIPVSGRTPYGNRLDVRSADWVCPPSEGLVFFRNSGLRAGQASVGPSCIALKLVPAEAAMDHRVGRAPFEPRDQAMINISYSWNSSK